MDESTPILELVRVETADGVVLDGALWRPQRAGKLPVDAFLLVHGTGSNFYAPGVLETYAGQALAGGIAVLRINTRGHDGLCSNPARSGSVKGGAAYERISDCVQDVGAWVDWLVGHGFARIVLVGHSMGSVKAIYAQAYAPHSAVRAIVGISPPRFSHERLLSGPCGETFAAEFARASDLVSDGQGETLLAVTQPLRFMATAAAITGTISTVLMLSRSLLTTMRDTSRRSSISCTWVLAFRSIVSIPLWMSAESSFPSRSIRAHPRMEFSGVRSSCEITARNSSLA